MAIDFDQLKTILKVIRIHLQHPEIDVIYAGFDTQAQVIAEYDEICASVFAKDQDAINELAIWFAPTGPLQELAISNGWSADYRVSAILFDRMFGK